ncbi:MAG: RNA methyltransferase [Candidatus Promineofilum sp.]|nr:RNA methyltransferase [Promineifilum sp.]
MNDRRARDEAQQTVVEGVREIRRALDHGVVPAEAYLCPELIDDEGERVAQHLRAIAATGMGELYLVSPEVFGRMAYRGTSGGLLMVIPYPQNRLERLTFRGKPFLLVVEEAEKPGNLGAILRTADAAGVDGVIVPTLPEREGTVTGRGTDLHNPNVIRASLGAYFTVPAVAATTDETIAWLHEQGIAVVAATPAAATLYTAADLTGPVALVVGSEAWGLSEMWLAAADRRVSIPMAGVVDSLNLSASAALLMYEVVRQRGLELR